MCSEHARFSGPGRGFETRFRGKELGPGPVRVVLHAHRRNRHEIQGLPREVRLGGEA